MLPAELGDPGGAFLHNCLSSDQRDAFNLPCITAYRATSEMPSPRRENFFKAKKNPDRRSLANPG